MTFAIEIYAFVVYYRMNVAHLVSRINASHGERLYNNVGLFISGIGLSFFESILVSRTKKNNACQLSRESSFDCCCNLLPVFCLFVWVFSAPLPLPHATLSPA